MSPIICSRCRIALQRARNHHPRPHLQRTAAAQSTASLAPGIRTSPAQEASASVNMDTSELTSLLSRPSWSVRSLIAPSASTPTPSITSQTLHHLLRLSALPKPQTPEEESQMLGTLSSQLHFVRAIQSVDTAGVTPLRVIRDETTDGLREQTIGLAQLQEALDAEDIVGHAKRPRRRRPQTQPQESSNGSRQASTGPTSQDSSQKQHQKTVTDEVDNWDVLAGASETAGGRYFVVRSSGAGTLPNGTVG
ncbi:hypothetical protein GGS20DRAFT_534744 [Poronia punctata]|nr:hypothetical protein GGS20DRAFT_534744 [Poronia punctata]